MHDSDGIKSKLLVTIKGWLFAEYTTTGTVYMPSQPVSVSLIFPYLPHDDITLHLELPLPAQEDFIVTNGCVDTDQRTYVGGSLYSCTVSSFIEWNSLLG